MDKLFKRVFVALIGINVTIGIMTMAKADFYKGYELPRYEVEQTDGAFEVRRYAPHTLAEVKIEGSRNSAIQTGFRTLARYIFGGNETGEKIAMTAPVTQVAAGENLWSVTFMMPSAAQDALPDPQNDAIAFRETVPVRQVSLQFAGWATAQRLAKEEARLRAYADAAGLETEGPVIVSYYDDPFTLPWQRRNEVALALR